jgi:hypothetical protein
MYALVHPGLSAFDLHGNAIGSLVIHSVEQPFAVAPPLYWREAPAEVTPYDWFVSEAGFERVPTANESPEDALQRWRDATEVPRFQARAALYETLDENGRRLFDRVEEIMALPTTPMLYRLAWTDALFFRRMSPTVLALGQMLGRTPEQLDQLFIFAKTIDA